MRRAVRRFTQLRRDENDEVRAQAKSFFFFYRSSSCSFLVRSLFDPAYLDVIIRRHLGKFLLPTAADREWRNFISSSSLLRFILPPLRRWSDDRLRGDMQMLPRQAVPIVLPERAVLFPAQLEEDVFGAAGGSLVSIRGHAYKGG